MAYAELCGSFEEGISLAKAAIDCLWRSPLVEMELLAGAMVALVGVGTMFVEDQASHCEATVALGEDPATPLEMAFLAGPLARLVEESVETVEERLSRSEQRRVSAEAMGWLDEWFLQTGL